MAQRTNKCQEGGPSPLWDVWFPQIADQSMSDFLWALGVLTQIFILALANMIPSEQPS